MSNGTIKNYQEKQVYINKAREAEKKYGIPENTLVGLLAQESGHFDPKVISGEKMSYAKAKGIGQFMDATAKEYGIDPLNVDQAIDASAKYLSKSYKNLGNWDDAILSYNAGEGRVREYRAGKPIKIKEHQEYVGRVKNQINRYGGNNVTFAKDVAPYMNGNINSDISNLDISMDSGNFASVPDVYKEEEPTKEKEAVQQLQQKEAENNFLEEYRKIVQATPQQEAEEQTQYTPPTNVFAIANQVSQFVDTPVFKEGGIMVSKDGVFASGGKDVIVPSANITMKGVDYPILAKSLETGEQKVLLPNMDYFFKNTKNVLEQPIK